VTLLFKQIKPSKLRIDAFRLEFLSMVHKAEREIIKDFKKTTETWNHKPEFESIISLQGGPSVFVGTDDEIYGWVNSGTPAHDIPTGTSGNTMLVFQPGFKPKTKANFIGSVPGGKFGNYVRRKSVRHPGITARNFESTIYEMWEKKFKRMAEEAMRNAARKSGHGV
jgi:hypothetical protein